MLKNVYYKPGIKSLRPTGNTFYFNFIRIHNLGNFSFVMLFRVLCKYTKITDHPMSQYYETSCVHGLALNFVFSLEKLGEPYLQHSESVRPSALSCTLDSMGPEQVSGAEL